MAATPIPDIFSVHFSEPDTPFVEDISRDYKLGILILYQKYFEIPLLLFAEHLQHKFCQEKTSKIKREFKCSLTIYQDSRD